VISVSRMSVTIVCAAVAAAVFVCSVATAQPNYLIPLPQKGQALALNNSGQVVYDTGLLAGGTFTAFPAGFTVATESTGILSESGVVVGATSTGHLATWSAGTVTDLGVYPWQFVGIVPAGINSSGQIVGPTTSVMGDPLTLYLYGGGVFNPINVPNNLLGNFTSGLQAIGLNDSGQIVLEGASTVYGCGGIFIAGSVATDLGGSCPNAINAAGQITGSTSTSIDTAEHAFIWLNGTLTVLTEPPQFALYSTGYAINKGGQIVGAMGGTGSSAPFFYNGVMSDINGLISPTDPLKSSVTIAVAIDINDSRVLLLKSTTPVVGSPTEYLLQAPWLDVAPGPLTFSSQTVGTTSQPQTLTLTNSGSASLPLDSISIAAGAKDFTQKNDCPQSLAAGTHCTASVTFAPSAAGSQNALLDVVTAGATITVPLAGTTPLTISMSATPASPKVGEPFTISWAANPGSTCQSSGGVPNDGWNATAASGSVLLAEEKPGVYTYSLACTFGGVKVTQSLGVTVGDPAGPGGKGALDLTALLVMVGLHALRFRHRSG
jgi:probable HAF family extracellular repeat protein